jgi:hypothetical protein
MTEAEYKVMVRESHRAMILQHSVKEGDPVPKMYGEPITEMDKEELMAVINSLSKRIREMEQEKLVRDRR